MAPARRRVSYIIPPPSTPVPRLKLPPQGAPRNGATGPLLLPHPSTDDLSDVPPQLPPHPRHRLGVSCLALDTSTQLLGRDTPEGILYTGGRDGLVLSWDLGISLKKRERRYGVPESSEMRRTVGRWEIMTGWADDIIEEETEDEEYRSDGDILGDVQDSTGRLRRRRVNVNPTEIPYEEQWETDMDLFTPGKTSRFRQSVQAHTDWVNDLLLCNYNQTVVSASSDGTVKAWSPHSTIPTDPVTIGTHADYARCLTQCRDRQWIASGSFDRTIKLWDPTRTSQSPLITLHPPSSSLSSSLPIPSSSSTSPSAPSSAAPSSSLINTSSSSAKSSVYALAADPYGMLIASGSPERVVRMWDPRSGKRIGKLVGHTDNIRAILVSEDAKYLLTGSADASIKLWSLTTQKCLHTFTHHADSVWSLHSTHPSLEIFYSGDRSGIVCRVDVEGCTDVAEGECVVLLQDSDQHSHSSSTDGVNKIVAMDDNLVWTATGSSSVKRWRVPGRRATRLDQSQPLSTSPVHATYASADEDGYSYSAVDSPASEHRQSQSQTRQSRQSTTSISPGPPTRRNSSRDRDREGEETWYGIPFESLVKLTSANEGGGFGSAGGGGGGFGMSWRGRDPEIATLYSAASIASVPRVTAPVRSPLGSVFQQTSNTPTTNTNTNNMIPRTTSPIPSESFYRDRDPTIHALHTSRRASFEDRDMAQDAVPLYTTPDEVIIGDYGLVRCGLLNDRVHAVTVDLRGEVGVWDVVRGVCVGRFNREDVAEAASNDCRGGSTDGGECEGQRSPREALDIVKERIEGEAVVATWASVDTKTGLLSVHLGERCFEAEVYADEAGFGAERHFSDEARINVGKWVLRNLFIHFIRDQHRAATKRNRDSASTDGHSQRSHRPNAPHHIDLSSSSPPDRTHARSPSDPTRCSPQISKSSTIVSSTNMIPAVAPTVAPPSVRSSPLLTPMIPLASSSVRDSALSPIPQSPLSTETTPMPIPQRRPGTAENGTNGNRTSDYFSLRARRPSVSTSTPTPAVPTTPDDFSGWGTPKPGDPASAGSGVPQTPTTPGGGLMGRLKAFGKGTRRHATEGSGVVIGSQGSEVVGVNDNILPPPKTPVQTLLAGPFTPPMSNEAPTLSLPPHMSLLISEEAPSGSGWRILYRGQVSSTGQDARVLEEVMPFWLLEYLLVNKIPSVPTVKISFVLLPWKSKDSNEEPLPELLNTAQSKLTASRFLRVRKLTQHVQDKLDKLANSPTSRPTTAANTPRSSLDARSLKSVARNDSVSVRAEEQYEILCDGMVLPLDMTLAAVRQFVWRSSGELVMYYRRKAVASPGVL